MSRWQLCLLLATVTSAVVLCFLAKDKSESGLEVRANTQTERGTTPSESGTATLVQPPGFISETSRSVSLPDTRRSRTVTFEAATPKVRLEQVMGPELGPGLTPATVMENLRSSFQQYRAQFGGNPVGENPEITACLNGANPKHARFIKLEDGLRVNERGELIDNWGTPFFFHQISRNETEIRSAGPDRKMWTKDDLILN